MYHLYLQCLLLLTTVCYVGWFLFAAYAAIANDSIQTIGTFIASNQDKKWWVLWIFIGGIFGNALQLANSCWRCKSW